MKYKLLFILIKLLFTSSCQLQINLASSVVNVPIVKSQYKSNGADMSGSKLDDIAKGAEQKAGDVVIPAINKGGK